MSDRRCCCRPQWFVRWGDDRGVRPVTPIVAARALYYELDVWLGKACLPCQRETPRRWDACYECGGLNPVDGITLADLQPLARKPVTSRVVERIA